MAVSEHPAWWRRLWPSELRGDKAELVRTGHTLELRFARGVGQSRMALAQPDELLIDYTRTMLAALLLQPLPQRIGMVGLGGGSQAKFCYRYLPDSQLDVMENNPQVIALRDQFRIPADDARLRVHLTDAASYLHRQIARFDLLLVDGYDKSGIPSKLSTQAFYDDCAAALTPQGVLASNLYARDHKRHVARLMRSFDGHVIVLGERKQKNLVAFAWKSPVLLPLAEAMQKIPQAPRQRLTAELDRLADALSRRAVR